MGLREKRTQSSLQKEGAEGTRNPENLETDGLPSVERQEYNKRRSNGDPENKGATIVPTPSTLFLKK